MDLTRFINFMKLKWHVIAISLVAVVIAVIEIGVFVLPAEITSSSGAIIHRDF